MIKSLTVRHFAIIDQMEVEFKDGMTVLTGETGAGKSLIIDAIGLLLGDRANQEMIRTGENAASVSGVFSIESERLKAALNQNKIPFWNDQLTIFRELSIQNKNTIKINDLTVTLVQLKEITRHLADIHSQFDTQRLLSPQNYLELIDGFRPDVLMPYLEKYLFELSAYQAAIKNYSEWLTMQKELDGKLEIYQFQLKELSALNLIENEEETLEKEASVLANFDKINLALNQAILTFENGLTDQLYTLQTQLETLTDNGMDLSAENIRTKDAYYELEDLEKTLKRKLRDLAFDPEELNRINERLNDLDKIKHKYKKTVSELIAYLQMISSSIDQSENYGDYLAKMKKTVETTHKQLVSAAMSITKVRKEIAKQVEKELSLVFKDLVLNNTIFQIEFKTADTTDPLKKDVFTSNGVDQVEFMISTNVGESIKPLSKTASGGEMSRIMLAFKTIFIRSQNLSTMIFDEIDTGISGHVAKQIAKKLRSIANSCQVLSISHVPQVVAIARHQLRVSKKEVNKRTVALIKELSFEERVNDIAEMISGEKLSETGIQGAKELLLEG
jgi:DNA repair protein RecN (Recombination protein N)